MNALCSHAKAMLWHITRLVIIKQAVDVECTPKEAEEEENTANHVFPAAVLF